MHTHRRPSFMLSLLPVFILLGVLLSACGSSSTSSTGNSNTSGCKSSTNVSSTANTMPVNQPVSFSEQNQKSGGSAKALQNVSIGLGYIPDIQFAPFYVAKTKGYYSAAGLNVTLNHGIVNNLLGDLALGHDTFAFASGDELLVARSKNLPLIDVSTIFQKYPVSLIVPASS
ncbi:MAG TPA: ABC transporter substrate-binding protein, partial [Ktedonobacteraceae bacterium]|nr:ABC transporter substrate-binding protein [Ktedonobacteraceae bacterium]